MVIFLGLIIIIGIDITSTNHNATSITPTAVSGATLTFASGDLAFSAESAKFMDKQDQMKIGIALNSAAFLMQTLALAANTKETITNAFSKATLSKEQVKEGIGLLEEVERLYPYSPYAKQAIITAAATYHAQKDFENGASYRFFYSGKNKNILRRGFSDWDG